MGEGKREDDLCRSKIKAFSKNSKAVKTLLDGMVPPFGSCRLKIVAIRSLPP